MMARLLLVDDEELFAKETGNLLRSFGHSVDLAHGGADALEMIKRNSYDVALVDMLMPSPDGTQTLQEIKKLNPLTEVIILTGHASISSGIEVMKLGAFDYLLKPCRIEVLCKKIGEACEKRSIALQNSRSRRRRD